MVGEGIKQLRESRNFTQKDLARILGVSRQAVCMWEANKRELKATMLNKIANIFDVSVDGLIRSSKNSISGKEEKMAIAMRGRPKKAMTAAKKSINFELNAPHAKKVALTGTFNSWDKNGVPMKRDKNGVWKTELSLAPGRHEYKFVVDGQWWVDPANTNTVANALGSRNSVKEVTA